MENVLKSEYVKLKKKKEKKKGPHAKINMSNEFLLEQM